MELQQLDKLLKNNRYPGRGIVIGLTEDKTRAVIAYFIMGRSVNSRNRLFVQEEQGIRTQAADPDKLSDPSLIIYAPVRVRGNHTIVTNGDQTDTIHEGLGRGLTLAQSLTARTFEPDAPNWTPRISGLLTVEPPQCSYQLSILKSADGNGDSVRRYTFDYPQPVAGEGHFIHTYRCDGTPIPSFEGEPVRVAMGNSVEQLADSLWSSLNEENKVSLFVRQIHLENGRHDDIIFNKYEVVS